MSIELNKFENLKRELYLWIIPIMILALLTGLLKGEQINSFNGMALIILLSWFSVAWFLLYKRVFFRSAEIISLVLISVLHLLKSYEVIYVGMILNNEAIVSSASFWTPLIFVYIFFTLKGKKGALYAISLWSITVFTAIGSWDGFSPAASDSLIQYQMANLVYIALLFFARHIIQAYTESDLLGKLAYEDSLTGIANRRKVHHWLDELTTNNNGNNEGFSIIFFDLDQFKRINDNFGHLTGDVVLKEVSTLVYKTLSKNDSFGRWGGEEFIIISPKRTQIEATELAEEIRRVIENHRFPKVGNVTSSFGVERFKQGDTSEMLMDRVDKAMYVAKQKGRNVVISV